MDWEIRGTGDGRWELYINGKLQCSADSIEEIEAKLYFILYEK